MSITTKGRGVLAALVLIGLLAAPALAADIEQFPDCGAPGDPVIIRGSGFDDDPAVTFGSDDAEVIRSTATKILCLVPEDADAGTVTVKVDGNATTADFTILEDGAPVVLRMSAKTATPGMRIYLVGRRLGGGTASFVDSDDETQAEVKLRGGRRVATLKVPDDLDAGDYTLVIVNSDEIDTGDCSPAIEIVEADTPALTSASPEDGLPGRHLTLTGTDLGPAGPCRVEWTDSSGDTITELGFSNGYDTIRTRVPFRADPGETYDLVVVLRGGTETSGDLEYDVGSYGDPTITEIDPTKGPAGSLFKITGENLLVLWSKPAVKMTKGSTTLRASIVGGKPGRKDEDDHLYVLVPPKAGDGDWDVTVTVGGSTTDAETFTVGGLALRVSKMKPTSQGSKGAIRPVYIEGAGFGTARDKTKLTVVWDDGSKQQAGKVVFRSDRHLMVIPPGDRRKPLAKGNYTVIVKVGKKTAKAGTYTVN